MENTPEFTGKPCPDCWVRIERIIRYGGYASVGAFAGELGLKPESFYQVNAAAAG